MAKFDQPRGIDMNPEGTFFAIAGDKYRYWLSFQDLQKEKLNCLNHVHKCTRLVLALNILCASQKIFAYKNHQNNIF